MGQVKKYLGRARDDKFDWEIGFVLGKNFQFWDLNGEHKAKRFKSVGFIKLS